MNVGKRLLLTMLMVVSSCLVLTGCGQDKKEITVGGKNFTEQFMLAELAADLLEEAGFDVTVKTGVGSSIARKSLENGQFDLYYEYTGTAYTVYYSQSDQNIMTDSEKVYNWVKDKDAEKDLVWLAPVKFNNTYTLMMRGDEAKKLGIKTISNLAQYQNENPGELIYGVDSEFWERPDGFQKVMKTYDFTVKSDDVKKMSIGLTYKALKEGQLDVAMGFSTDGRIAAFGFVNLVDDKNFFPVYNPVPVVRKEVLDKYPEIKDILRPLSTRLNTDTMQKLNAQVDVEHKEEGKVAEEWLKEEGLI
ncbi:MAG: glycine betaine ABC transporter substrate-binding protein [Desulfovibrionales bacterium]